MRTRLILGLAALAVLGAACGTSAPEAGDGSEAAAVLAYGEDLQGWGETEEDLLGRYDSVTGNNYTDDEALYTEFTELIPDYRDFLAELEEKRYPPGDVRGLHDLFTAAHNKQYSAMTQLAAAVEQFDTTLATDANERLIAARRDFRDFEDELERLLEEHQLEWVEQPPAPKP